MAVAVCLHETRLGTSSYVPIGQDASPFHRHTRGPLLGSGAMDDSHLHQEALAWCERDDANLEINEKLSLDLEKGLVFMLIPGLLIAQGAL